MVIARAAVEDEDDGILGGARGLCVEGVSTERDVGQGRILRHRAGHRVVTARGQEEGEGAERQNGHEGAENAERDLEELAEDSQPDLRVSHRDRTRLAGPWCAT